MRAGSTARLVPIVGWLRSYDRGWLRGDVVAGMAVAALIIPKNLGYAGIAGVPLENGLYAAAAAAILYAVFGTSLRRPGLLGRHVRRLPGKRRAGRARHPRRGGGPDPSPARLEPAVGAVLSRDGVLARIGVARVHASVDDAVRAQPGSPPEPSGAAGE